MSNSNRLKRFLYLEVVDLDVLVNMKGHEEPLHVNRNLAVKRDPDNSLKRDTAMSARTRSGLAGILSAFSVGTGKDISLQASWVPGARTREKIKDKVKKSIGNHGLTKLLSTLPSSPRDPVDLVHMSSVSVHNVSTLEDYVQRTSHRHEHAEYGPRDNEVVAVFLSVLLNAHDIMRFNQTNRDM